MKKCPTCEKTFDDNLRFCQTDGTPLVAVEEEAAPPEDPYKTTVARSGDLPVPPDDPYKTIVAGIPSAPAAGDPPPEADEPEDKEDVLDLQEAPEVEEIDPLKTIVSTGFPAWPEEPEVEEETPAAAAPPEEPAATAADDISSPPPDPPKFSEPDLNPPNFGDLSRESAQPPAAEALPPADEPPVEIPPVSAAAEEAAAEEPSEPAAPPPAEPPKEVASEPSVPKDSFGDSPFGKPDNAPIPSPFGDERASSYQPPSTPMPSYQEAERTPPSPFSEPEGAGQPLQESGWSPPPSPGSGWQNQEIAQNTPFQPPPAGTGQNQTLAIVSLVCGILSLICGFGLLTGIPALITGFMARKKVAESPAEFGGSTLAMIGMILGGIGTVVWTALSAIWLIAVLSSM